MNTKTNLMLNDILLRLEVIDKLIQKENTGTPGELSHKCLEHPYVNKRAPIGTEKAPNGKLNVVNL